MLAVPFMPGVVRIKMMKKKCGGQLLVEILIGLAVITMALVVSLTAVTQATKVSRVARNRLEATKYGEKVLETYRNTRDLDRETFFGSQTCTNPCGTFGDNNMYSCTMTCTFTPGGAATRVDVTVTLSWDDSGNTISVSLPTVLTKYDL